MKSIEETLSGKINEVLIVDDCSNDQTIDFFVHLIFRIKCFFNSEKGLRKNNFAASEAKGEFLCLLNNDCFVERLVTSDDVLNKKKMSVWLVMFSVLLEPRYRSYGNCFRSSGNKALWSEV